MTTFREILPEIWGCVLFDRFRNSRNEVYGEKFLIKQKTYAKIWIADKTKTPGRSNIRLRSKNECSYCKVSITALNGVGDHIVGKKMDELFWLVPCCKSCNSSKGKKDLVDWWVNFKGGNFNWLLRDVISIFIRAKYRLLEKENRLDDVCPKEYHLALNQIKDSWRVK